MERQNAWDVYSDEEVMQLEELCGRYRAFLDAGKTERVCVDISVRAAEAAGYRNLSEIIKEKKTLKTGDKV